MEEMRRKLAAEKEELLRERSRCAMARLEADAQEEAWAARKAEADEEAREEGAGIHNGHMISFLDEFLIFAFCGTVTICDPPC